MSGPSLEQLFATFLATGDEAALAQWMRRSAPTLRQLARRLGVSAEDADDLVQETIVAAIHGAARYDASRPLLPWLKGILAFRAAKLARLDLRQQRLHRDAANVAAPADTATPESVASDREFHASVHDAIAELPNDYRTPLQQYLFAGRSPVEIARGLGIERATVRVRLHRGIRRLRHALARWVALLVALVFGRSATAAAPRRTVAIAALGAVLVVTVVAIRASFDVTPPATAADATVVTNVPLAARRSVAEPAALASERVPVVESDVASLVVCVVDPDGHGVPRAGVTLEPSDGVDPVLHRRRAVTDGRGEATFAGLARRAFRTSTDRGASGVVVIAAGVNEETLTVPAGNRVRGRVVDAEGNAVADAAVWLSSDSSGPWRGDDVVATDGAGRFELTHVPDAAFVAARHAEFAGSDVVRLDASARVDDVELQLGPRGSVLDVVVLDADGSPCADAMVFVGEAMDIAPFLLADGAAPWREPPFERRSGRDGTVRCGAFAAGRHPVFVRAAGRAPWSGHVDVGASGTTPLVVRLQHGGRVLGRVVDGEGEPVRGALVVFRGEDIDHGIDVRSAADGTFAFECVPPGAARIAARSDGRIPCVQAIDVLASQDATPRLVLSEARSLRGTIEFPAGAPLPRTVLRATWPRSALLAWQVVDEIENGAFTITAECAGRPSLEIRSADEAMWRPVDAFTTWQDDTALVRLPAPFVADAWLGGVARSDDGQPLAASRVFVHRDGVQWAEVGRTNDDGTFRIGPLPAAKYRLFFESTLGAVPTAWSDEVAVARGEVREVRFDAPSTGEVELEFVRADGAPTGELAVTLVDTALERRAMVSTKPRLRQRLVAGDYRLFVMGEHVQWLDALPIHVTAGETLVRRIELQTGRRCVLAVRGLPRGRDAVTTLRVRERTRGEPVMTFSLLPDAPERLTAMLASGDYVMEYDDANGTAWFGEFRVDAAGADGWSIPVPLTPRVR